MKKLVKKLGIIIIMITILVPQYVSALTYTNNISVLDNKSADEILLDEKCETVPTAIKVYIYDALKLIRWIALVLLIVLGTLDFVKAIANDDQDAIKKSSQNFMRRLIAVIILFLLPLFIELGLGMVGLKIKCPTIKLEPSKRYDDNNNSSNDYSGSGNNNQSIDNNQSNNSSNNNQSSGPSFSSPEIQERFKKLFPNGAPTTKEEADKYMKTISVPVLIIENDQKIEKSMNITVHKDLVSNYQNIFKDLVAIGFPIDYNGKTINPNGGAYVFRDNVNSAGVLSHHSYGVAIDINVHYNPNGGTLDRTNKYAVTDEVVAVFARYGFYWGGNWKRVKDYMHFSYLNG